MSGYADKYTPSYPDAVRELITDYPMVWMLTGTIANPLTAPVPVRPVLDADGALTGLRGHIARGNPQVAAFRADPHALVLSMGPHSYLSPSWLTDRTQAPTWDYATAVLQVEVRLIEDPAGLQAILDDMISAMEAGREKPWASEEMGPRREKLSRGIVGFEAKIISVKPRFRMGQDEREDVYQEILRALKAEGQEEMLRYMKRCNPGR